MIRVGIGGWTFAPWCGSFYPEGLPHARELAHASRQVTAIEVNGTFYRTQTPASFRKWADEAPDHFVFALKGHRSVTNRSRLAEAGPAIARFIESGIAELGAKLGPINWQLGPAKKFDPEDVDAFLSLLPREVDSRLLRHAIEVRHPSFVTPDFVALARRHRVAIVFAEADEYPAIADPTADFIYARLQRARESEPKGYAPSELNLWAERARIWRQGGIPDGLPLVGPARSAGDDSPTRDVFMFFISGDKIRNPAAATALLDRL